MNKNNEFLILKQKITDLIHSAPTPLAKNEIAKILKMEEDERRLLKLILKELEQDREIIRGKQRRFSPIFSTTQRAQSTNDSMDKSTMGEAAPPATLAAGRGREKIKKTHIAYFTPTQRGGFLSPCHRKDKTRDVPLSPKDNDGLVSGDVVAYTATGNSIKIIKKIGNIRQEKGYSQIAIAAHGLQDSFSPEAIRLAEAGEIPPLGNRTDYRHLDLVTIDGEDARDFDDAVWARADTDPRNEGGWRLIVAIADVAYYVRPGDALDREAYERGNSVYFPDRVVPMLPEALSNELCSLKPHVDRACMAIEMIISAHGKLKSHRIKRGLMKSRARLTYDQVQNANDGNLDDTTTPLKETVIDPLYGAFRALLKARTHRGTLDIDMPERQVILTPDGKVQKVIPRIRHDSHKLIEEFMIAANVAAAKTLSAKNKPCLYRIHDAPDPIRVQNLGVLLKQFKLSFAKTTKPTAHQFNDILHQLKGKPFERLINDLILRSQSQAVYSPLNIGHYGLSLTHYAHFTSPIRRYADLKVHRALISCLNLRGDDEQNQEYEEDSPFSLEQIGAHISATERQAAMAEREVTDRYMVSYLAHDIGHEFPLTIVGVNTAGLFVEIKSNGAQGFIPKSSIHGDFFSFDQDHHRLVGRRTKTSYQLGQPIQGRLREADPLTSTMTFELIPPERALIRKQKKPEKTDHRSLKNLDKPHERLTKKPSTKKRKR